MKIKLLISLISALLVVYSAYGIGSQPAECPSVDSIILGGIDYVAKFPVGANEWGTYKLKSQYNTSNEWTFMMFLNASDQTEALAKALTLMKGLSPSTIQFDGRKTACYYVNKEQTAAAVNPPEFNLS